MTAPQRDHLDDDLELELEEPVEKPAFQPVHIDAYRDRPLIEVTLPPPPRWPMLTGIFNFPWYRHSLIPWMMISVAFTMAGLAVTLCYFFLSGPSFVVGRVIAIPAGILTAAAASYASICFLTVIEQTSDGYDVIEEWPLADWRDGFWTLPQTFGWLVVAGGIGYFTIGQLFGGSWLTAAVPALVLYPFFLISSLETARPSMPLSWPIFRSLGVHWQAWALCYLELSVVVLPFLWLFITRFPARPFANVAVAGPVLAAMVLICGRVLGRLAWCCADRDEDSRQ